MLLLQHSSNRVVDAVGDGFNVAVALGVVDVAFVFVVLVDHGGSILLSI